MTSRTEMLSMDNEVPLLTGPKERLPEPASVGMIISEKVPLLFRVTPVYPDDPEAHLMPPDTYPDMSYETKYALPKDTTLALERDAPVLAPVNTALPSATATDPVNVHPVVPSEKPPFVTNSGLVKLPVPESDK